MKLHENKTLFRQAVRYTSERMGILPIYIEKDYWVTYALYTLFNHEIGRDTVFKGGTALSKCYRIIERFSEDIDLIVLRREGESNNQLTSKIKTIGKVVGAVLPEVQIDGLTHKMGMNRKTAHTYTKVFDGNYGQVRDVIVIEATWLGYFEPSTVKPVISIVGQMMVDNGQDDMVRENGLLPFEVRILEPKRTICEKIMSLVRFSYTTEPLADLRRKIRHIYDLHQLLNHQEFSDFFDSDEFSKMLLKVANDDVASYKNNNAWLVHHPNEALIFKDPDKIWGELRTIYTTDFKGLVYGQLPDPASVLDTLKRIKAGMKRVQWDVRVDG